MSLGNPLGNPLGKPLALPAVENGSSSRPRKSVVLLLKTANAPTPLNFTPPDGYKYMQIFAVAPGGAGGSGSQASTNAGGGGGGSGASFMSAKIPVTAVRCAFTSSTNFGLNISLPLLSAGTLLLGKGNPGGNALGVTGGTAGTQDPSLPLDVLPGEILQNFIPAEAGHSTVTVNNWGGDGGVAGLWAGISPPVKGGVTGDGTQGPTPGNGASGGAGSPTSIKLGGPAGAEALIRIDFWN